MLKQWDEVTYRNRRWIVTNVKPSGLVTIESELGERLTTLAERLSDDRA